MRDEIENAGTEVGKAVGDLASKLNIEDMAEEAMAATQRTAEQARKRPVVPVLGAGVLVAVVVFVLWWRRG